LILEKSLQDGINSTGKTGAFQYTDNHVAPGLQEAAAAGFDDFVRTHEDVEVTK
jgi:hypothetical protein